MTYRVSKRSWYHHAKHTHHLGRWHFSRMITQAEIQYQKMMGDNLQTSRADVTRNGTLCVEKPQKTTKGKAKCEWNHGHGKCIPWPITDTIKMIAQIRCLPNITCTSGDGDNLIHHSMRRTWHGSIPLCFIIELMLFVSSMEWFYTIHLSIEWTQFNSNTGKFNTSW